MTLRWIVMSAALFCGNALAVDRWVAPPAPEVTEGTPIRPEAEVDGDSHYIIHLPKAEQADFRSTRYSVYLERNDEQAFSATLETQAFGRDDEVVFLTIPKGSKDKYELEVVDRASYPHVRVFKASLGSIQEIAD